MPKCFKMRERRGPKGRWPYKPCFSQSVSSFYRERAARRPKCLSALKCEKGGGPKGVGLTNLVSVSQLVHSIAKGRPGGLNA